MEIQRSFKNGNILKGVDAIIERYEIALLTSLGEFSPRPQDGIGIDSFIDESTTKTTLDAIKTQITSATNRLFPSIQIRELSIKAVQSTIYIKLVALVVPMGKQKTLNITYEGVN